MGLFSSGISSSPTGFLVPDFHLDDNASVDGDDTHDSIAGATSRRSA